MKRLREFLKPLNIRQFILANIVFGLLIIVLFMRPVFATVQSFLFGWFWAFIICLTQWLGPVVINRFLDRKIKWIEKPVLRAITGISTLVCYSVLAFIAVQFVMFFIWHGYLPANVWKWISGSIIIAVVISVFMSLIFTAIGFFVAWKRALIQSEKLKAEMMAYKYESLRNQINPHFLFNSFNVLSDLVYADQAMALRFIQQMSGLFRYVLDSRDKELVPLKEESEFLESYIFLLKTRFEDKLNIEVDVEPSENEYIVPMTLQMLVENAVKHNEVSERYPLKISIHKKGEYLEVENSLRIKNVGYDSKGTGLKNIEQQFSFFTEKPIAVIQTEVSFLVRIPVIILSGK